jgi:Asp-tRNA(Asn)/Glu-tRNA(Gln) amidotransferase C subunit
MPITRQDVIHVANLAHLELDSAAIDTHVTRLAEILEYGRRGAHPPCQ